ncbi:NHL domain-containing protein [Streptomyces sp. NPDC001719]
MAGTGVAGYDGDGLQATSAQLNEPGGVAFDKAGSLYIADINNHLVRMVDTDTPRRIFTVAGTGTSGYSGDGGPATNAQLSEPVDVALAPDGSLYIADWANHVVRRVGPDGMIRTVAGTGTSGYSGDGGPATNAQLMDPVEVAVDGAGNLYIADREGQRVRRVQMAPPATFTVEQASPNPVDMTPGMTTQMAFTVIADPSPVPAGQNIGLTFPAGVGLAAGGVCRYICPADGTNIPLRTMDNGDGTVSVTAPEITGSPACFYSCDVQATTNASGILEGRITVGGTTQPVYFSVSPVTYTIEQASPNPVDVTPGMITQMAFTVTASATVTGQNITMTFPPGVVFPTDGVIRWICPADGTNIPQPVNTNADGTVSIPNQTITPSAACFYSCDLQATTNTAPGITEGTITVTGTNASGPFYCNITS